MARSNETLKQKEIGRLISADKVQGTPVSNPAGERIGSIENVMIDKPSGRVAYAVMSFGGVLGIGKDRYPLPWDLLEYDAELDALLGLDPRNHAPVLRPGALAAARFRPAHHMRIGFRRHDTPPQIQ